MSKSNPFQTPMARLQQPDDMRGSSVSIGGFTLEPDDDGVVEVPAHLAPSLIAHGMTPAAAKPAAAKGARG